jgi:hypothetical protein
MQIVASALCEVQTACCVFDYLYRKVTHPLRKKLPSFDCIYAAFTLHMYCGAFLDPGCNVISVP